MKKILSLICAVALVSGVSAQVKQAREVGTPLSQKANVTVSPLSMPMSKGAVKAEGVDTIAVEAAYHAEDFGLTFYGTIEDFDEVGHIPAVWWLPGTGWLNHYYGSGEVGYSIDFSADGWFCGIMGQKFNEKGIVGALALIGRAKSTVEKMNKDMPFKFKLYSYPMGQVARQMAYNDITSNQSEDEEPIEVFYPRSPEQFLCYSEEIKVPLMEKSENEKVDVGSDLFGAKFETPGLAGAFSCISFMFPCEHNDEDTLWNATLFPITDGNDFAHSDRPGSVYVVYDFNYQNMWGRKNGDDFIYSRERGEGFVLDTLAQPDKRYGIIPLQSWWWTDRAYNRTGDRQDWEPFFRIILADGVDIERGAAYDKYVEVKINPAIDYTMLQSPDKIKNVEIYNLNGKLVKTQACNGYIENISLSGLTSGMYIAKVTTESGIANKKIMVR